MTFERIKLLESLFNRERFLRKHEKDKMGLYLPNQGKS